MPFLSVYANDRTMRALETASRELGRTVEDLAEAATAEAALKYEPPSPSTPGE